MNDYSKFLNGKQFTAEAINAATVDDGSVFAGWDEGIGDAVSPGGTLLQMNGRNTLIHDNAAADDGVRPAGILNAAFWFKDGTIGSAGVKVWRRIVPPNKALARRSALIYAHTLTNADGTSTGRFSLFTVEAVRGAAGSESTITVTVTEIAKSA